MSADLPPYALYNNCFAPWSIDTRHISLNPRGWILNVKLKILTWSKIFSLHKEFQATNQWFIKKSHHLFDYETFVFSIYTGIWSFLFLSGISGRIFYVFLVSPLHSTFPLLQQIAPTYWRITNVTMEWYWMWFAHFHSERCSYVIQRTDHLKFSLSCDS